MSASTGQPVATGQILAVILPEDTDLEAEDVRAISRALVTPAGD